MNINTAAAPVSIDVTVRGDVVPEAVEYARSKVERATAHAPDPVLAVRVVLTMAGDPAVERRARAEASVDVNGTQIRAVGLAPDMLAAIDQLDDKLTRNVRQYADRRRTRHRWIGLAAEHQWRHGDLATSRADVFPRPSEEREVVRRKTFASAPMTADEAAFEMDLLGHDFYLFTDVESGEERVVRRHGDEYAVVADGAALTEDEARRRLDLSGEDFLLYLDPEDGRGHVLYLRYDGHYGLITSAR